ncbi:MAG: FGGY-family carbohydrate kinase [Rubrivivax sp.]
MSEWRPTPGGLDLVLDVGKTRSKLLVLDRDGAVVHSTDHASGALKNGAYASLDTFDLAAWLEQALADLGPLRAGLGRAIVSAHGAAFACVQGDHLAGPVPDYEFAGFDDRPTDWAQQIGGFEETCSPDLPRGLNAATQFDWLERHGHGAALQGTLLPYGQYWAWWFSGVLASEVSALGCHTHLWNPSAGAYSQLAERRGWAGRFAPLRRAWEVLGPVRPALAQHLGLPAGLRVHTGAHDSNACLARYLRSHPRMTLVTTGTWVVVMGPGAPARPLDAERDLLCNVSVRNEPVPTGRFMGGRELQQLCAGADPQLANADTLQLLLQRGVLALPGFEAQGGPFRQHHGGVEDAQGPLALHSLSPTERATLAALYTAQVTAWIVDRLGGAGPVVVEGPFAHNPVYTGVLAALLPQAPLLVSTDALEGTARGAWMLAHWTEPGVTTPSTAAAPPLHAAALQALHRRWCERLAPAMLPLAG